MNLYMLCREAGIPIPSGASDIEVGAIRTDSRKVTQGDLFVCIRGMSADGHDFVAQAVAQGAAAIIVEKEVVEFSRSAIIILVENTRHAAALLYDAWYGHPSRGMKLIAVTGTNGKTSVSYMIRAILEGSLYRCGLIGTVRCYSAGKPLEIRSENPLANLTTPDPEELYRMLSVMAADGVEYVVMEASSHALALGKLDALSFEAAVFTNLTQEHLDFHGNMENYFFAKAQLFSKCKRAIINLDDPYGARLAQMVSCRKITCSQAGRTADFCAEEIRNLGVKGSAYSVVAKNLRFSLHTPIPGKFSVINTLQAGACASALGIPPSSIVSALSSLVGVEGRLEAIKLGGLSDFSVFIDYAHTPDALQNLLETVREFCGADGRIVLVFGCGGDRDRKKRSVMGRIASTLADFCIVTSDNSRGEEPKAIIEEILSGIVPTAPFAVIPDRAEAIDYAIENAKRGDVILLAGKGHEEYEIDKEGKHPFCEKALVREAFLRYWSEK